MVVVLSLWFVARLSPPSKSLSLFQCCHFLLILLFIYLLPIFFYVFFYHCFALHNFKYVATFSFSPLFLCVFFLTLQMFIVCFATFFLFMCCLSVIFLLDWLLAFLIVLTLLLHLSHFCDFHNLSFALFSEVFPGFCHNCFLIWRR